MTFHALDQSEITLQRSGANNAIRFEVLIKRNLLDDAIKLLNYFSAEGN